MPSLRGAKATKQSILSLRRDVDCFAALAMTDWSVKRNCLFEIVKGGTIPVLGHTPQKTVSVDPYRRPLHPLD
jgi:hypothetical protein